MAEENVNEVLGIEDTTSQNGTTADDAEVTVSPNNSAENALNVIAAIVLWCGIIATVFCLFALTTTKVVDPTYKYSIHYDTIFNPSGLVISIGVFLSTLTTWSLLRVIANISMTLKQINSITMK